MKHNKYLILNIMFSILLAVSAFSLLDHYNDVKDCEKQLGIAYNSANQIYETAIQKFEELDCIYRTAEKYQVPPEVVLAVMKVESNFDKTATSNSSCGLMQVNKLHLSSYGLEEKDLYDVNTNVEMGTGILSECIANSPDLEVALGKYNRGVAGYEKYISRGGNRETRYAREVKKWMQQLI